MCHVTLKRLKGISRGLPIKKVLGTKCPNLFEDLQLFILETYLETTLVHPTGHFFIIFLIYFKRQIRKNPEK